MFRRSRQFASPNRKRGAVTLEFIVAAPMIFIALIAIFEFAFLAIALQFGHSALIEGTRRAAELYPPAYPVDAVGADNDIADSVVIIVNQYLGIHCLEVFDSTQGASDDLTRPNAQLIIERNGQTIMRGDALDFPVGFTCTPSGVPLDVNEARVTLCFRLVDPAAPTGCGTPVPDWLSLYGLSLGDCMFQVSARMTVE